MTGLNSFRRAVLPGIVALALLGTASQAQQSFKTPEDAAAALAAAVKNGPGDILKVLGRAADDIVSSGDEIADNDIRQRFTSMYDVKHGIKAEGNKAAILVLGPDDFPFPLPLVNTRTGWEFDTKEGRAEVLRRRIGRNELDAIEDPAEREDLFERMVAAAYENGKALNTATIFEIDDVIDPADSRRWITTMLLADRPTERPPSGKRRPNIDTW